jgi:hypothetical protein
MEANCVRLALEMEKEIDEKTEANWKGKHESFFFFDIIHDWGSLCQSAITSHNRDTRGAFIKWRV